MRVDPRLAVPALLLALMLGCPGESGSGTTTAPKPGGPKAPAGDPGLAELAARAKSMFGVLPKVAESKTIENTDELVALGRALYFDTRLSKGQGISCNTCHDLQKFGVDGQPTSPGHKGQRGERNSPTVYNSALQFAQFWDGRAADVEAQATMPITNPVEMAMADPASVVAVIKSVPGYEPLFKAAFPDEADAITLENAGKAVGAYERRLMTPSRFDEFMGGKTDALNEQELRGLRSYIEVGCTTCHAGPLLGGQIYQKWGLIKPVPNLADTGRHKVTGQDSDRFMFKVPQLRNITRTGPYLHDGSEADLSKVVAMMGEYQLGKTIPPEQIADIVAFMGALEGALPPADLISKPELPPNGPSTPAADPN